jgi:hypothetical protein
MQISLITLIILGLANALRTAATSLRGPALGGPIGRPGPGKVVLYVEGIFDNSYSPTEMVNDAKEIAASGADTIILAFLHYHRSGSNYNMVYNNIPFSQATTLPACLSALRAPGTSVSRILLSIGGASNADDFDNIKANWAVSASNTSIYLIGDAVEPQIQTRISFVMASFSLPLSFLVFYRRCQVCRRLRRRLCR